MPYTKQPQLSAIHRRALLQTMLKGGGAVAISPFFPSSAFALGPAEMTLLPGTPNPAGAFQQLYWLGGNGLTGKVENIIPQAGASLPQTALIAGEQRVLRLFHFNDLHNHLTEANKKKGATHRFSQMHRIVEQARSDKRKNEAVLLFSAGDDHTGTILDELSGWQKDEFVMDSAYRTYTAAGVDASAIGNHELDRGAEQLRLGIRQDARFPVLSANVHSSAHIKQGVDYYSAAIGVIDGLRVGLVGLTTPVDTHTGSKDDPGLAVASPVESINHILPTLSSAVDFVIVLSHCGYGEGSDRSGKAGAERYIGEGDQTIARAVAKVSRVPAIVIGGHTHTVLNEKGLESRNVIDGVPIVQAGGHGSHLGEVEIHLARDAHGQVSILKQDAHLHKIKKRDQRVKSDQDKYTSLEHNGDYDQAFEVATVAPLFSGLKGKLEQKIAMVEHGEKLTTAQVISERYVGESAIANFMNDALIARSNTFPVQKIDVSLFNATGLSAGIPAHGALTFESWYNVMPYADSIQIFNLTGRQVKALLDSNVKRLVRPEDMSGSNAVDVKGYVSRGFLHFSSALRYQAKLNSSAKMAKAVNITLHGVALEDQMDTVFRFAINSYIGAGGYSESWNGKDIGAGVMPGLKGFDLKSLPRLDTGLIYRNEIIARIKDLKVVSPDNGARYDNRLIVS